MRRKKAPPLPAKLERVRSRFERWRKTKQRRTPIPDALWNAALKLTEEYSVHRVARVLHLNGTELMRRAVARGLRGPSSKAPRPTFVEVGLSQSTTPAACIVEMEDGQGAKLRVSLRGQGELDLVGLSEAFWSQGT
jgi:hypothetical protein